MQPVKHVLDKKNPIITWTEFTTENLDNVEGLSSVKKFLSRRGLSFRGRIEKFGSSSSGSGFYILFKMLDIFFPLHNISSISSLVWCIST